MELQQQKSEFLNSISGRFNLKVQDKTGELDDGRHKSTDRKAVMRKIFTKMKPHMNVKVVQRASTTAHGLGIKKDVKDIPVTEETARR